MVQAITPIEAAYQLKSVRPSALSPAGARAGLLVPFSPQRASNPLAMLHLPFM